MLKTLRHIVEILVILLVSAAVLIPWFGYIAMDFSQPTDVAWVTNDKGEKQRSSFDHPNSIGECSHRFYQLIHSPVEPEYLTVVVLCLLTAIGLVSVSCFLVHKKDEDDIFDDLAIKTIVIQLFLTAVSVVGFLLNSIYLNPKDVLRQIIADQELADKVIGHYTFVVYIGSLAIPLVIFIFLDIVIVLFGTLAIYGISSLFRRLAARTRQATNENRRIIDGRVIVIHRNRTTEYLNLELAVKWIPWPVAALKKECFSVTSLDAFLSEIANEARRFVTNIFLSSFKETAQNCLSRLDGYLISAFARVWQNQLARWIQTNANRIKSEAAAGSDSSAEKLLDQTSRETAERIRQEISATAAEMVRERLSGSWSEVMGQLRPIIIQNQNGLGNTTPILPEGAKIFLAQGNTTLVVVEQKPQIRSVLFSGESINELGGLDRVKERPNERFNLAFPYTLFVLRFENGRFYRIYFFYHNQPLKSVEDTVSISNLPNIDDYGHVCLGEIRDMPASGLAEQTEAVITHFWNSLFNLDMASRFMNTAATEPRLATLKRWEENTSQNPAFVLSVKWTQFRTLKWLFQSLLRDAILVDVMHEFEKFAQSSTSDAAKGLGEQIAGRIAGMDFSGLCHKTAARVLDQELNAVGKRLVDTILANADKALAGEGEKASRELSQAMIQTIPEMISDNLGKMIAGGQFSSQVNVWDTMLQLVPRREETISDGNAAHTNIHPQEG